MQSLSGNSLWERACPRNFSGNQSTAGFVTRGSVTNRAAQRTFFLFTIPTTTITDTILRRKGLSYFLGVDYLQTTTPSTPTVVVACIELRSRTCDTLIPSPYAPSRTTSNLFVLNTLHSFNNIDSIGSFEHTDSACFFTAV